MATYPQVCDRLAELVRIGLNLPTGFGGWPTAPQTLCAIAAPPSDGDFISWDDGTFCQPRYSISAWILGPNITAPTAFEWICTKLADVPAAIDADPTLGGAVSGLVVASIGPPGSIAVTASTPLIGAEVRFAPFFLI